MRLVVLILAFALSHALMGQIENIRNDHSTYVDPSRMAKPDSIGYKRCIRKDGKMNGLCATTWPDGGRKSEGIYVNDTITGTYRSWYENGNKNEEWNLTRDNLNGTILEYWPNGEMRSMVLREDGEIGQKMLWNGSGTLILQEVKTLSNYMNRIKYHDNGELESSGTEVNGKPAGFWRYYDERGQLCRTEKYENGELIGSSGVCD